MIRTKGPRVDFPVENRSGSKRSTENQTRGLTGHESRVTTRHESRPDATTTGRAMIVLGTALLQKCGL
jgi:hypothetical protein